MASDFLIYRFVLFCFVFVFVFVLFHFVSFSQASLVIEKVHNSPRSVFQRSEGFGLGGAYFAEYYSRNNRYNMHS